MNHEQINTFIKVMETGSFNKASEILFITPSAIMRQMNRLETELEFKLFTRTGKGMKPTIAGEHYYQEILKWNQQYENIVKESREIALGEEVCGKITIGIGRDVSEEFIRNYWEKIKETFPNIHFKFISYGIYSENLSIMIKDVGKKIDIVIESYVPSAIEEHGLKVLHLCENPISCAVSINSDLYMKKKLKKEDLYGKTVCIWGNQNVRVYHDIRKLLETFPGIDIKGIEFQDERIFDVNNNEIVIGFSTWAGVCPLYKWIPLDVDYKVPYGIWYHKTPSPKVKAFIEKIERIEF